MRVDLEHSHPERAPGGVDHAALFRVMPTPCVVLDPELVIRDCNAAYEAVTGRRRADLLGCPLFVAFPDLDPATGAGTHVRQMLGQALRTRRTTVLGAQRYDISPTGDPADSEIRYWTTTVVPVLDDAAEVTALLYNVHDVTALTQSAADAASSGRPRVRDLFRAAVDMTEQARLFDDQVIAERQLGLAVQDAMLPAEVPAELADRVVVRYRPASHVLHVGGDWYDVSRLDADRFTVAVGDVVGHGLTAAVVMGQLRAALNALTRAHLGPAQALTGLDGFARQDPAATASTALKVVIDPGQQVLTYSSAGHPPAILVEPDGTSHLLDQAQGPALAIPTRASARPAATVTYRPGARLVLYTDGLVERRGEDFDVSLQQLAGTLRQGRRRPLGEVADLLLRQVGAQQADDIALVLLQL